MTDYFTYTTLLSIPPRGTNTNDINMKKTLNKNYKENVMHRLLISKGHLDKVIQMLADGEYCIDIIHQSQAVQAALKKVDEIVLENHLKTCVLESSGKKRHKEILLEVMEVVKKA